MARLMRVLSIEAAAVVLAGVLFAASPAQSRAHRSHAGVGCGFMRAVPALSQSVRSRIGAGHSWPLLRCLLARRAPSPPARRSGIPTLQCDPASSPTGLGSPFLHRPPSLF